MKLIDLLIHYKIFETKDEAIIITHLGKVKVDGEIKKDPNEDIDITKDENVIVTVDYVNKRTYTIK